MRSIQITLYSIAAPFMIFLLPVMNFSINQVGDYVRGDEFRQFSGEILIQLITGFFNAIILGLVTLLFGGTSG